MEHVVFGRTGLSVSRLWLGTMTFGLQCDPATSFDILDAASDHGITFIPAEGDAVVTGTEGRGERRSR